MTADTTLVPRRLRRVRRLGSRIKRFGREPRTSAEILATLYMAGIAASANRLHLFYILFPELGALAIDVLTRPYGKWAKEPWKLVATPAATAVVGVAVSRHLAYGVSGILLIMALSIAIILIFRSAVVPAISAGVLPLILGVRSWLYPPSILFGLIVLSGVLLVWRRCAPARKLGYLNRSDLRAIEVLETRPKSNSWFVILFLFTTVMGVLAALTGWRFILFPPLLVMAYEMLGHPDTCAWAKPPFYFPLACCLAAVTGVLACRWIRPEPLAVMFTLAASVVFLRLFRLRMPPALSIGLLPFVMTSPTFKYAVSVGIGTLALTGTFLLYRKLVQTFSTGGTGSLNDNV